MIAALVLALFAMPAFAETTPPTVGSVTSASVYSGVAVTLSATYNDMGGSGVTKCQFVEGGSLLASTTFTTADSGTYSAGYTFSSTGTHNVQAQCQDADGNWGYGATTAVDVSADATAPTVGPVTPVTATVNSSVSLSATYSDSGSGVTKCQFVEGGTLLATKSFTASAGGTASANYTFTTLGTHNVQAQCQDASGNWGYGATTGVAVSAADTEAPTVGAVSPVTAAVNQSVTLSANYNDTGGSGVTQCQFVEGGTLLASKTFTASNAGNASANVTFTSVGTHSVQAQCKDASGNWGYGATTGVDVSSGGSIDTTPPSVGIIQQTVAVVNTATTLSASVSDNVGIASCSLYVNGVLQGSMNISSGIASRAYTFAGTGSATAYATCMDAAGNSTTGSVRSIAVTSGTVGYPTSGSLIKNACPANADVNHPCKAVYFVGNDGKRHAFPNEKVYFTWYSDFNAVTTVADSVMASFPLGNNVTYRPGVKMVKFTTVPKVYAVTRYGVLRWVSTQSLAGSLYGSAWNQKIDDISDAFYSNYTFGADITNLSDYNPSSETATVTNINLDL